VGSSASDDPCQHSGVRSKIGTALCGALGALVLVVLMASPASADPARPTNYQSEVTRLDPPSAAVKADIVGGDSFIHIVVDPGHEVTVSGYDGEPYLRVAPDGTVFENTRSPAVRLNTSRYGAVGGQPNDVDSSAEPSWRSVASGGEYVWHDHRTHWMGKAAPPQLQGARSGVVFDDWTVPLVVDGTPTTVHGTLVLTSPPSVVPWLAIAAVVALVTAALALRRDAIVGLAVGLAIASVFALVTSTVGQFGLPAAAGRQYHFVVVPAIALVAAVLGITLRRTPSGLALVAGAALTLPLWVFGNFGVLTHAHPATDVDGALQKAALSLAIGAVVASVVLGVVHEARTLRRR
jgi:hypothetical protein